MQLYDDYNWATTTRATTGKVRGSFVGVAIGPESDEGVVLVNGRRLQAGRALMLAANEYQLETTRAVPVASIARLQLMLFECAGEVAGAGSLARSNGVHGASAAITAAGGFQTLITVPFAGRRHARFQVVCGAASIDYRIWGQRYHARAGAVKESLLRSLAGEVPDANQTLAFHLGGTNEEEVWDALRVELSLPTDQDCTADVETVGELGAH